MQRFVGNHGGNLQSADMPLHSDAGANAGLELASRVHHDGVEFPRIASEQLNVLHNQQVHDPTVQVTASSKTDPLSTRRLHPAMHTGEGEADNAAWSSNAHFATHLPSGHKNLRDRRTLRVFHRLVLKISHACCL
ncbi:hypothetical protein CCR75_008262 [Bremia lactucae]|uniref:Uncharacterized protein n=1 Tax=Bremia lactucae TaxID=4779 RepID=A0A976NZR7_BRELC|nr:hypothetical protein CCR75_008262 [Bremia lactucae]